MNIRTILLVGVFAAIALLIAGCVTDASSPVIQDSPDKQMLRAELTAQTTGDWPSLPPQDVKPLATPMASITVSDASLRAYLTALVGESLYLSLGSDKQKFRADGVEITTLKNVTVTPKNTIVVNAAGRTYFTALFVRCNVAVNDIAIEFAPKLGKESDGDEYLTADAAVTALEINDLKRWPKLNQLIAQLLTKSLQADPPKGSLPDNIDPRIKHPTSGAVISAPFDKKLLFVKDRHVVFQAGY